MQMKQPLLIFCFLLGINSSFGQTVVQGNEKDERIVFVKVEIEAQFPGGDKAWGLFLQKNLNAAVPINNGAKQGRYTVITKFIVNKDSTLTDIVCENDPGYGICQEAIRIIKLTEKWEPAIQNGRVVNSYRRQPFTFVVE